MLPWALKLLKESEESYHLQVAVARQHDDVGGKRGILAGGVIIQPGKSTMDHQRLLDLTGYICCLVTKLGLCRNEVLY